MWSRVWTIAALVGGMWISFPGQTFASVREVNACSLLSDSDAGRVFHARTISKEPSGLLPNNHSSCLFVPNSSSKASIVVDISWSKSTLASYSSLYSEGRATVPVTTPTGRRSGQVIKAPHFSRINVDGRTSYWLPHPPVVGSRNYPATYNANLISEKSGYVIGIYSLYLGLVQDKNAMEAALSHL
jgi:hypothetical protein